MAYPMVESKREGLRGDFDRRLKLEFHGSKITPDTGFLSYRELEAALGLTGLFRKTDFHGSGPRRIGRRSIHVGYRHLHHHHHPSLPNGLGCLVASEEYWENLPTRLTGTNI